MFSWNESCSRWYVPHRTLILTLFSQLYTSYQIYLMNEFGLNIFIEKMYLIWFIVSQWGTNILLFTKNIFFTKHIPTYILLPTKSWRPLTSLKCNILLVWVGCLYISDSWRWLIITNGISSHPSPDFFPLTLHSSSFKILI